MKSKIFRRLQIAAAIHMLRGIAMKRNAWLLQPFNHRADYIRAFYLFFIAISNTSF